MGSSMESIRRAIHMAMFRLAVLLRIAKRPSEAPSIPLFQDQAFWGAVSTGAMPIGLFLAWALHDFRWALWISLPFWCWAISIACKHIPTTKMNQVIAFLLGSLVVVGCLYTVDRRYSPDLPTVMVDPTKVLYDAQVHREFFTFLVRNQTDSYVYTVQLKLRMPIGSSQNEFSFDLTPDSRKPIVEGSPLADIGGVRCESSLDHRPIAIFLIYRIEPHGVREVKVTHDVDSESRIDASVTTFSMISPPRTDDIKTMFGNIHIDEKMACNGCIGFFVDPNHLPIERVCTARKL
jgi:hypothetical protein